MTLLAYKEPAASTRNSPGYRPRRTRAATVETTSPDLSLESFVGPNRTFTYAGRSVGWAVGLLVSGSRRIADIFQPGQAVSRPAKRVAALWDEVEDMKSLTDDWNGYGSEAPNAFARDNAKELLLASVGFVVPSRVSSSAQGGVGICFVHGGRYADIECLNTGEILATTSTGKGVPEVWEVKPRESREALKRIGRFIHP